MIFILNPPFLCFPSEEADALEEADAPEIHVTELE